MSGISAMTEPAMNVGDKRHLREGGELKGLE